MAKTLAVNAHEFDFTNEKTESDNMLVISPYTDATHLLNLNTLDIQCQLLAKALTTMQAVTTEYATAQYIDAFNWDQVLEALQKLVTDTQTSWNEQFFYIVVFRSCIPPTTDRGELGALDKIATAEAVASGGFLKYWFGTADDKGRNLATCLWRNREDAKRGLGGKGHHKAASAARFLYTEWKIERLRLTITDDASSWSITEW